MRRPRSRLAIAALVGLLAMACASAASPSPAPTSSPSPASSPSASATPSRAPSPSLTVTTSLTLPLNVSARAIGQRILMAPGPDGSLYVSIPRAEGSALALLDAKGEARDGWPIAIPGSTSCGLIAPAGDGSVRTVCDATDPDFGRQPVDQRAFSFDRSGRSLAGWPVRLAPSAWPGYGGRLVGDELTLVSEREAGNYGSLAEVVIAADGSIRSGADVPKICCDEQWAVAVGPEGVVYGGVSARDWAGSNEVSRVVGMDLAGMRTGWPAEINGIPSAPAFGPEGRIVVAVGSQLRDTSHILIFQRGGNGYYSGSAELAIRLVKPVPEHDTDECFGGLPQTPIIGADGTIFLFSAVDSSVYALNPSPTVIDGWPFAPAAPIVRPLFQDPRSEISCPTFARPAVGPDSTLYLPLQARDDSVGGSLVAVGPDGRVRSGWPVELTKPGAEFWQVVVGSDGTVFALAIEPEAGDGSSASILAIAPDSTVISTTTIVDP